MLNKCEFSLLVGGGPENKIMIKIFGYERG
jgi:hypothetical protein